MAFTTLDNGIICVAINPIGAELSSLRDAHGKEYLWQGGVEWPRRAPVLFPIVGRMPGDLLEHDGRSYPIGQHGFARDQEFEILTVSATAAVLSLKENNETLAQFPFPFRLDIQFSLEGERLGVLTTVSNTGTKSFSASLGEHPGFIWPLSGGIPRSAHTLTFSQDESAPIRRIVDGLLLPDPQPTPVLGRTLPLEEGLFAADAIIFDRLQSHSVHYSAPDAPSITVDFADFPTLGVWSKVPAEFLCIEPWFGTTAPVGFAGEYSEKPGQFSLKPGEVRSFAHGITVSQD